ncbi:MAG: hypothetical protein A2Y33_10305 [Spirochaetes bacterium GWF1_51_8]|nr:MAG: hypothetical protein A2Y33_10305 [Spirochaetes bacterium GWF1_51_8]
MKKGIIVYGIMLFLYSACAPGTVSENKPPQGTNNIGFEFIYVSVNGNDTNSGVVTNSPLRSLPAAIAKALASGSTNILVTGGIYSSGSGLNSSTNGISIYNSARLKIAGGYDTNFSLQTGMTILDGADTLFHVIEIENSSNIVLRGLIIVRGKADGDPDHTMGGGIYIYNSFGIDISNCIVSNNSAKFDGGGIYLYGSSGTKINGLVSVNTANNGGGIYLCYCGNYTIGGMIYSNLAGGDGGGIYVFGGNDIFVQGIVSGNLATNFGGGVCINGGSDHSISGHISNNTSLNSGGGVHFNGGNDFSITGIVTGNNTDYAGGGVYIGSGSGHSISGSINGNSANTMGGGVLLTMGSYFSLNGTITGNNAAYGGGVYLGAGSNHTISGIISRNEASVFGGGIYLIDTGTEHTFSATISSNSIYGVYTNSSSNPVLTGVTWGAGVEINSPANVGP